jgi:6-phosphogluconolactonase
MTIDPSGKYAFVTIDPNTVGGFILVDSIDPSTHALTQFATILAVSNPTALAFVPSGRFFYVASAVNPSANGALYGYSFDPATGAFAPISGGPYTTGQFPVCITIDSSGKFAYIANVNSNNVSGFSIDSATGALTSIAGSPFADGSVPVSIAIK